MDKSLKLPFFFVCLLVETVFYLRKGGLKAPRGEMLKCAREKRLQNFLSRKIKYQANSRFLGVWLLLKNLFWIFIREKKVLPLICSAKSAKWRCATCLGKIFFIFFKNFLRAYALYVLAHGFTYEISNFSTFFPQCPVENSVENYGYNIFFHNVLWKTLWRI